MDASLAENKVLKIFNFSATLAKREFEWNFKFKILEGEWGEGADYGNCFYRYFKKFVKW